MYMQYLQKVIKDATLYQVSTRSIIIHIVSCNTLQASDMNQGW